jgi:magnesium transporter
VKLSGLLGPELEEVLRSSPAQAAELLEELHAADLADLLVDLPLDAALTMLTSVPREKAAEIFDTMEAGSRAELAATLDRGIAAEIAEFMSADERADLFKKLPDEVRAEILARMEKAESQDVRDLLRYPENTAGALMTTDYAVLSTDLSIERAIEEVRATAEEKETIYDVYVTDPNGKLLGVLSLRDMVLAKRAQKITDVMNPAVIVLRADMDQEEVARVFQRYNLMVIPVVDETHRLLGIVTVDDVVHVMKEEQAEDIQMLGAVAPTQGAYFDTGFWTFLRSRAGWLVVLFVGQSLTARVLKSYGGVTAAVAALTLFLPLIISSGGNTGNQAASLIIRGMALGEFGVGDAFRILWRELRMGLALGTILAGLGIIIVAVVNPEAGPRLALAVGAALVGCVTFGSFVGAGMPLLIRRLGFDPAVASGPFVASLLDVVGILIYIEIAMLVLGLNR